MLELKKQFGKTDSSVVESFIASEKLDAVFCVSDQIGMMALQAANELGLKVPQDLSVVGFGNLDFAELACPPLTTIAQPFKEMGRLATKTLLSAISESCMEISGTTLLPVSLCIRKSS